MSDSVKLDADLQEVLDCYEGRRSKVSPPADIREAWWRKCKQYGRISDSRVDSFVYENGHFQVVTTTGFRYGGAADDRDAPTTRATREVRDMVFECQKKRDQAGKQEPELRPGDIVVCERFTEAQAGESREIFINSMLKLVGKELPVESVGTWVHVGGWNWPRSAVRFVRRPSAGPPEDVSGFPDLAACLAAVLGSKETARTNMPDDLVQAWKDRLPASSTLRKAGGLFTCWSDGQSVRVCGRGDAQDDLGVRKACAALPELIPQVAQKRRASKAPEEAQASQTECEFRDSPIKQGRLDLIEAHYRLHGGRWEFEKNDDVHFLRVHEGRVEYNYSSFTGWARASNGSSGRVETKRQRPVRADGTPVPWAELEKSVETPESIMKRVMATTSSSPDTARLSDDVPASLATFPDLLACWEATHKEGRKAECPDDLAAAFREGAPSKCAQEPSVQWMCAFEDGTVRMNGWGDKSDLSSTRTHVEMHHHVQRMPQFILQVAEARLAAQRAHHAHQTITDATKQGAGTPMAQNTAPKTDAPAQSDHTLLDELREDGVELAYRLAGSEATEIAQDLLVDALTSEMPEREVSLAREYAREMLRSKAGTALVGLVASFGLPYLARVVGKQDDPRLLRLARECRRMGAFPGLKFLSGKVRELAGSAVSRLAGLMDRLPEEPAGKGGAPVGALSGSSGDLSRMMADAEVVGGRDKARA